MAKNEVRYNNDLNTLRFKDFTQLDYDMLMCVCKQMNGMGAKEVKISYDTIMELMQWDEQKNGIKEFQEIVFRVSLKLSDVKGAYKNDTSFKISNLFEDFEGNIKTRILKVRINPKFVYLLNDINNNFTKFELREFLSLESKYAKTMYMQIKQRYKWQGHFWQPTLEELRHVFDIPEKYEPKIITRDIVLPSVEILRGFKGLEDLEVEPIKAKRRGSPVIGYRFTWTPDGQIKGQSDMDEALAELTKYKAQKEKGRKTVPKKTKNKFNQFAESPSTPKTPEEWDEFEKQILDN